jgi:hypothetical protein
MRPLRFAGCRCGRAGVCAGVQPSCLADGGASVALRVNTSFGSFDTSRPGSGHRSHVPVWFLGNLRAKANGFPEISCPIQRTVDWWRQSIGTFHRLFDVIRAAQPPNEAEKILVSLTFGRSPDRRGPVILPQTMTFSRERFR